VNCGKILEYPSLALLLAGNNVLYNVQASSETPNEKDVASLADQKSNDVHQRPYRACNYLSWSTVKTPRQLLARIFELRYVFHC